MKGNIRNNKTDDRLLENTLKDFVFKIDYK